MKRTEDCFPKDGLASSLRKSNEDMDVKVPCHFTFYVDSPMTIRLHYVSLTAISPMSIRLPT